MNAVAGQASTRSRLMRRSATTKPAIRPIRIVEPGDLEAEPEALEQQIEVPPDEEEVEVIVHLTLSALPPCRRFDPLSPLSICLLSRR